MENDKIRIRTPEELEVRKKEFLIICDVLEELKIKYFLQTGILLGAVRDNDFIKWDWDIEISVFSKDFLPRIHIVANSLKKKGFRILNINEKKNDSKIDFIGEFEENVTGYTIFSWNYSKLLKKYWRRELSVPEKFLKDFSSVNFLGKKFNCPNNPEQYLEFAYGNWKIPLRTADKNLYNTNKFKNKPISYLKELKNKLIVQISKFTQKL